MPTLLLHQFPISHYCEKIRWVLDRKQLKYTVKNQFPGVHAFVNRRLVGRAAVPVLIDGHHAVGNSSDIALYLDDQFPEKRLIPGGSEARSQVLALEAYFDEHAGPAVRRYIYSLVTVRPSLFKQLFFTGYPSKVRFFGELASGAVAKQIARMYKVRAGSVEESLAVIERACERLEQLIASSTSGYLIGDTLTLADVTAASLLAPLVGPPESPWDVDVALPELLELRQQLRARPAGNWILARYRSDRARGKGLERAAETTIDAK